MKILVITGSAHIHGASAFMAEKFIEGAIAAGNEISRVNASTLNIKGCLGCNYCRKHDDGCIQKDEMTDVMNLVCESEMIVFSSPIYFMGISSQLKTVIDRFFVDLIKLKQLQKKMVVLMSCNDKNEAVKLAPHTFWTIFSDNIGWNLIAEEYAQGCNTREDVQKTDVPDKLYKLGSQLTC